MPDPVETSTSRGGSARYFKQVEGWLNDANNKQANRAAARHAVVGNLAGVSTASILTGPPAPTLANNPGVNHFNRHWRGGSSGWWPNITRERVSSEMARALDAALDPKHLDRNIRLKWDCSNTNVNAGNSAFYTSVRLSQPGEVWIDITSPRAP
jgi:hypothetical protein